jgi:hypothetical protein
MSMDFHSLGKWLIGAGFFVIFIGVIFLCLPRIPWIGRLPGDIYVKRDNYSFYFPLTTCLILSILASLLFRIFKR